MSTGHLNHYIERYLVARPSRMMRELFLASALLDFATSAVMIFEPIYLYRYGFSLREILMFFVVVYCGYLLLLPLGAKIARSRGSEHAILFSSPFLILYYLSLFAVQFGRPFIAVAAVALIFQKMLYWPSYHATFAASGEVGESGKEVSSRAAMGAIIAVVAPAIGGFVIVSFGFSALFAVVAGLILISNLPLLMTPTEFKPAAFSYLGAVKCLFAPRNRRNFFAFVGFGEDLIALTMWPIFIFLAVRDTFQVGIMVSVSMLVATVAMLYIGKLCDEGGDGTALRIGTIFTFASWAARPFVTVFAAVFAFDAFYRVARSLLGIPMMMRVYDGGPLQRDGWHKTGNIEGVVFFEMALSVGKIAAGVICIVALSFWPGSFAPMFAVAAAFTLLYGLLRR